ncbi:MAG: flagellar motor stator protein MotA [Gammaproteobacteria bacterium]|nr:flagellar motor stator protein MotA [Gammaproteobacteria bacterium]
MKLILGAIVVMASVLGGFMAHGGKLLAIWQPFEIVIICGAALGAFIIANPMKVVMGALKSVPALLGGPVYKKQDYMDLLGLMYDLFSKARKEGLMGIESDIEEPEESAVFQKYPRILKNHHAVEFVSDYMRLVVSGSMNSFELDNLMDVELETHHHEVAEPGHAVQRVADALPAFGIVAAVLGIVNTMESIGGPIEQIGGKVAAALVGTFLGILLAYGFVGPMSTALERRAEEETRFLTCLKACILANVQGYSPQVAVEFGRKTMSPALRPSFQELEDHLKGQRG